MSLFGRKKEKASAAPSFPAEEYEPVIRCSICTGEQVACMRHRETGRLRELMLLRTEDDLDAFCRQYGLEKSKIRKVY